MEQRENMMKLGRVADDGTHALGETDQWRVYSFITRRLEQNEPLRLIVQASAGTGKSFLLTTVSLWCLLHNKPTKAAAPTGIAAANVEIEETPVHANTIHIVF